MKEKEEEEGGGEREGEGEDDFVVINISVAWKTDPRWSVDRHLDRF